MYLKDNSGRVVTISRQLSKRSDGTAEIRLGWSACNPVDNHNKRLARRIADGRREMVPVFAEVSAEALANGTFVELAIAALRDAKPTCDRQKPVPHSVQRICAMWLRENDWYKQHAEDMREAYTELVRAGESATYTEQP